jgi:dynein light intermediate chain
LDLNSVVDELIRQVTINCAERGLLLLRVRDECRMTTTSYQALYMSSIAYGIRKALLVSLCSIKLNDSLTIDLSEKRLKDDTG